MNVKIHALVMEIASTFPFASEWLIGMLLALFHRQNIPWSLESMSRARSMLTTGNEDSLL